MIQPGPRWPRPFVALFALLLSPFPTAWGSVEAEPTRVDVLVYGGTPAGIAAALEAGRDGAGVVLVEPTRHLGGLTTAGLSHTDFRTFEGLNGTFLDFAGRVEAYYRTTYGDDSEQVALCRRGTQAEPHVNELVFEQMLAERPNVAVRRASRLASVETAPGPDGRRSVTRVDFDVEGEPAASFAPRFLIDATYEGDLMAGAGTSYRVGREGRDEYGESLAPARADGQLQAYNFRLIMTREPALLVPVARPDGYRRDDFAGVLPFLTDGRIRSVFGYPSGCLYKAHSPGLPNGKYDINDVSNGLVRLSLPGANLGWPDGDPEERARIFEAHLLDNVGLLYFLQHDDAVPPAFRDEARAWGWCRDEFADSGHLPPQLYVREARRMVGEHVFNEHDTDPEPGDARAAFRPDAIAIGDYGLNCHGTAHEGPRFGGKHAGEFYKGVAPYQIPYGVLVPLEIDNLLVPVACSASHVGYCALRLEPIWTSLGQASGVATRVAMAGETGVPDVDVGRVQGLLHREGAATIYVSDVPPGSPRFAAVQWLGTLGGLHGLAPTAPDRYGRRGPNIEGQYYEAFPDHAFEPDRPATAALIARWIDLLPAPARPEARRLLDATALPTRGEVASHLHDLSRR